MGFVKKMRFSGHTLQSSMNSLLPETDGSTLQSSMEAILSEQGTTTLQSSMNALLSDQNDSADRKRSIEREKDAERKRRKRENESEEERAIRLEKDRLAKAQKAAELRLMRVETDEERNARLAADAGRKRQLRQNEDPVARAARLAKMRLAMRKKRESMTDEQRAAKNQRDRERMRIFRRSESVQDREIRLAKVKESMRALRDSLRLRDAFRDEVSKRMGELLLKGQTMLDEYCPTCNGILMEDRAAVRRCITCELFQEKLNETGNCVAEIPLQNEELNEAVEKTPPPVTRKATPSKKVKLEEPDSAEDSSLDVVNSAKEVVLQKLEWAVGELSTTSDVTRVNEYLTIIKNSADALKSLKI